MQRDSPSPSTVHLGEMSFPKETLCFRGCHSGYFREMVCVCMCVASPFLNTWITGDDIVLCKSVILDWASSLTEGESGYTMGVL